MKLPNAEKAVVEREKIVDYLLNAAHPDNGGKAAFFLGLGFSRDDWQGLIAAFGKLAGTAEVSKTMESPHGRKFVLDGRIEAPGGKAAVVRTIWIVDRGQDAPRLVTAYHMKNERKIMIKEHERVVLTMPVPAEGLEAGDVGTVVHLYRDGLAYEVEFTTLDGKTAAVVTLEANQVRPVGRREITHARELSATAR